ncbi:titin isoform X24 [Apis mellifera carnica]|nr:titin isoform X24 [Apis mellifera carnica]
MVVPTEVEEVKEQEQQVTEVVTVEEEGKAPETTVTEGPVEEIVEETIKPLPGLEKVVPTEVEEVKEQVTVTEETTKLGKPKKTTKKKIVKRRGKQQQVTEVVTVEEEGKAPETTVTEGPVEEIVEETIKPLPDLEKVVSTEIEEVKEQVTVTEEITKLGKPKKTTKKKIVKRRGKEQQVTEVVTVEEEGKAPKTTVTEGPVEEIVEETIKPLPGKPKKTTKKKIVKRRGKQQQVTEVVTVEEEGKAPETTVTEGPVEEIVEETIKPLPDLEKVVSTEIEEVKEQVTVTEEITKLGKPKKTTKKKIVKRRGKEQQVTEVVTVEEEGKGT